MIKNYARIVIFILLLFWFNNGFANTGLKSSGIGLVIHDMTGKPTPEEVTSEFVYVRFHGNKGRYKGRYSSEELKKWAMRINAWKSRRKDVYAYFNNDAEANAVVNAKELNALLEG